MRIHKIMSLLLLVITASLAYFVYSSEANQGKNKFRYGLDLSGGSQLVYVADTSTLPEEERSEAMRSLRDVVERRANLFGVSEPIVQVEKGGLGGSEDRLIVELPGITDIEEAVKQIGETPILEFKLFDRTAFDNINLEADESVDLSSIDPYTETGLTGSLVKKAQMTFDQIGAPAVQLSFNGEGKKLFADITRENTGEALAIFLDGQVVSQPTIQDAITDGVAIISGNFEIEEARQLIRDLNYGALPIPVELAGTQTIGPSLGSSIIDASVRAALIGLAAVAVFLIAWYRLPGLLAVLALALYVLTILSLFKVIPVVLTAAGIAGFVLSIGMAVDANVLIFERLKEELRNGRNLEDAVAEGFSRAWPSIRDANISSLITAIILFWMGTSLVKGFALTFGIGVLVSMLTAIFVTKTYLRATAEGSFTGIRKQLFTTGFTK